MCVVDSCEAVVPFAWDGIVTRSALGLGSACTLLCALVVAGSLLIGADADARLGAMQHRAVARPLLWARSGAGVAREMRAHCLPSWLLALC